MRVDISLLPALAAAFMLVFARIGAMVMLLPGLGESNIPVRIKLAIALVLTLVILPLHRAAYQIDLQSLAPLRRRARCSHRRERAAGEGLACHRGDRRRDPGGTLPCGRRDYRLRHGSQARVVRLAGVIRFAARKCAGNERNEQKAGLTGLRSRARFRHSGECARKARSLDVDRLRPFA